MIGSCIGSTTNAQIVAIEFRTVEIVKSEDMLNRREAASSTGFNRPGGGLAGASTLDLTTPSSNCRLVHTVKRKQYGKKG